MIFILQWMFVSAFVLLISYPLARYVTRFFRSEESLFPHQKKLETKVFRFTGLYQGPMDWITYLESLLKFELWCFLAIYIHARWQSFRQPYFKPDEAFQFAASFITNTNWQSVPGEVAWGNPLWIFGVVFNNFQSAAVGFCVLVVFARLFSKSKTEGVGNFWKDLWRTFAYILLPLCFVFSLLLVSQGVPQNFKQNLVIQQYDKTVPLKQTIPMGPFAIQDSIKLLGTNGGSFTQANGASPIENPTGFALFLGLVMMMLLPSTCCFVFANLTEKKRVGWYLWAMMWVMASIFLMSAYFCESSSLLAKEWRMGTSGTVLWNGLMTATATGSIGGILDELQPLSNGAYLFLMNIGEIAWGGVGMGVMNLMMVLILSSFIMNLLTGRSASFLRKPIPLNAIKLTMFYIIFAPCLILLVFLGVLVSGQFGSISPSTISVWWYAISSWIQNNGSGYYTSIPNDVWMNYLSGFCMLAGRFVPIMMVLTLVGILKKEGHLESHQEAFQVDSLLFCTVSVVVIFIVTLLAFLPLWSFGPLSGQVLLQG